ncbi:unnamed protein product [Rangifer tarandus platyrhynchus]|uniref:Uncharacterized protein n=1 Tax=Rangifer tarandus platyrhynchus TaxID=3082113 RepID=A0AC59ZV55_RANTA
MCAQSCLTPCTLWTVAPQVPLSKGFFRQEFWNREPFTPPAGWIKFSIIFSHRCRYLLGVRWLHRADTRGSTVMLYGFLCPFIYLQEDFSQVRENKRSGIPPAFSE